MRIVRPRLSAFLLALSLAMPAAAQEILQEEVVAPAADEAIRDIDTLVVSGVLPGPGLWKVSHGDNVMWVLGTVSPLPKKMEWEAREVGEVIAGAQEVMLQPTADIDVNAGFFGKLALAPKVMGARKNPDGKRLQDVVPAADYARWATMKRRYIGGDGGIEKWRPVFAAQRLYSKAVESNGLRPGGVIPVVEKLARAHRVTVSQPTVRLTIEDPRQALAEFRGSQVEDLACFTKVLSRVENDMGTLRERANAWAIGDIEGLRQIPFTPFSDCSDLFDQVPALRDRVGEIRPQVEAEWLREAERALSNNTVTLALMSMHELLSDDGLAAALRTRGYRVEAPGEYEAGPVAGDVADAAEEGGAPVVGSPAD